MSHGCGDYTVDAFLEGKPLARGVYDRLHAKLQKFGDVGVHPVKTRIAFMGRARFATISRAGLKRVTVTFNLSKPVKSERIARVDHFGNWYHHHVPVTSADEIDDELLAWLRESYHEMGMQERINR